MNRALVGIAAAIVAFACLVSPAPARADEPPAAPAPPTTAPAAASPTTTTEPPAASSSHRTAWPWIIMGAGIALVVTATVIEIHAVSEDDKREKAETQFSVLQPGDPARAPLVASAQTHDDAAKSNRTLALIVGTVGFLTIAGSVVLWFYEGGSSSSDPPKAAKPKPIFTPSFGPGYAGAAFGTSF